MNKSVIVEKKNGISIVTLNRPEILNAISSDLLCGIIDALNDAENDTNIGVVILTGAGRAFCAGGDLDEVLHIAQSSVEVRRNYLNLFKKMFETILNISKPVIAAVNGHCIGGGNEINVACDLTIASEKAKFGQAGARIGSAPLFGIPQLLPLLVGEKKSREITYMCKIYDAHQAEKMGLVNKVVPHDELMGEAELWAQNILEKSRSGISIAKKAHNVYINLFRQVMDDGIDILTYYWGTEEAREGMIAFKEKRKPVFKK